MDAPKFAETHNLVAFLSKPEESNRFEQIIDFLNANPIKYALTVNLTIYTTCIQQFWATAKAKIVNGECQIQALVDKKKVIITETSVRSDLQLDDAEGIECLPNNTIFEQLTLVGAKTIAWNKFSSTMASAIICLATNQKFNFSKYIFDCMVKNLEGGVKFLMHPSSPTEPIPDEVATEEHEPTHSNDPLLSDATLIDQTQGRNDEDLMFDTSVLDEQEVEVEKVEKVVSTVEVEVTTASAKTTTVDELTLAQTLMEIKAAKPKAVITTATTVTPAKDKGKVKMVEPKIPLKKKDQIMFDKEVAQTLQAQLEAELEEEERLASQKEEEANISLIES
ncbi:hypothetical protein Tco_0398089 [Tanacetum coccineum]